MLSFAALVVAFLLGGVTLLPLLIACFAGFIFYTSPVVTVPRKTGIPQPESTPDDETEIVKVYRAGWLTCRRTYEPFLGPSDGTYVGALVSGYRSFMDNRSRDPRRAKPKDKFYGLLKQNVLFLYDNEDQIDCWAAIEITAHDVLIYPSEGSLDGELFVKRNAICLRPKAVAGDVAFASHAASEETTHDMDTNKPLPWFLFVKVNMDKEDWLFSLIEASKLGTPTSTATLAKDRSMFDPDDMARLVEGIDQQPDSIPMRWLNALFGRIFLSVYRTESLEAYITSRIVRKLKRVKTPSILSEIQVREVNVGSATPFFSKPMLKELTPDGDASMEVHLSYVGDLRITIETVATINLGSRFKPYSVRLILAVVLKEIEGTLLFKIKKPPSNRVWFGFSAMPRMVLSVEPVVSTRQISWSMITSPIESRIREIVLDSLVVPHMDDFSFFDSRKFGHRGGIWGDALRKEHDLSTTYGGAGDEDHAIGTQEEIDDESLAPGEPEGASTGREEAEPVRRRLSRRRSSDGDRSPLTFTPSGSSDGPSSLAAASTTSVKSGIASSASSLSSFSLASWRDGSKAASKDREGSEKRKSSWFASSGKSTPPTLSRTSTTSTLDDRGAAPSDTATDPDLSASKLRDILTKRAKEREKEKENARAAPLEGVPQTPKQEELALGAPPSDESSSTTPVPLLPFPSPANKSSPNFSASPLTASPSVPDLTLDPPPTTSSPPLSRSISNPSTSPTPPPLTPPTSTTSLPPPPLPSRTLHASSSSTLTPPAIPRRTHSGSVSVDASSSSTAPGSSSSSLFASLRTKAADKQALAAGVAQAKDTMKRWGATWNARKAEKMEEEAEENGESGPADGGRGFSMRWGGGVDGDGTGTPREEEYRDYRAGKGRAEGGGGGGNGDYFGGEGVSKPVAIPQERARRESRGSAAEGSKADRRASLSTSPTGQHPLFNPSASQPTTKLSTAPTFAPGSPTAPAIPRKDPPATASPGRPVYQPAGMMVVPGIRDSSRRQAVASDHVSAAEVAAPAPATPAPATPVLGTVKTPSVGGGEAVRERTTSPVARVPVPDDPAVLATPLVEAPPPPPPEPPIFEPDLSPSTPPLIPDIDVEPPTPILAEPAPPEPEPERMNPSPPALPPRHGSGGPPLPPRSNTVEQAPPPPPPPRRSAQPPALPPRQSSSEHVGTAPPALPPRGAEPPALPPRMEEVAPRPVLPLPPPVVPAKPEPEPEKVEVPAAKEEEAAKRDGGGLLAPGGGNLGVLSSPELDEEGWGIAGGDEEEELSGGEEVLREQGQEGAL